MASASTTEFDAILEAARNRDIPDVSEPMCWPMLMMFLTGKGVNTSTRSEADWKHSFNRHRKLLREELGDDKGKGEERSPSLGSEGKSETVSLPDSAYQSESPRDRGDRQPLQLYNVYAVVKPDVDHPEGRVFLTGCFSDDADEDYIIQTIYERLKIPKGKDGKVSITYTPHKGGNICRSTFAVREDVDGQADIVFTRTRPARKEKPQQTGGNGPPDLSGSMEASERMQQRMEEIVLANALAELCCRGEMQDIPDEVALKRGRKMMLHIQGAKEAYTVNDT